jgi:hypothetical protein
LESRDVQLRWKRRVRVVLSIALAIILGVASGLYLHSCEQESERTVPPAGGG